MSVGKGFSSGFGGCLGVGCAVVFLLVGIPVGLLALGIFGASQIPTDGPPVAATSHPSTDSPKPVDAAKETPKPKNLLTRGNFAKIQNGMTYDEVVAIIGPPNEQTAAAGSGEYATSMYTWQPAAGSVNSAFALVSGANANVTFQSGRVFAKAQLGLSPDESDSTSSAKAEAPPAAEWRTWTDASGKHKTEAQFKSVAGGKVTLVKRDGEEVVLPLSKLSRDDKAWVKDHK